MFDADDLEGLRFNQIITEIERSGFEVVRARKLEDAEIAVQTDAAIARRRLPLRQMVRHGDGAALTGGGHNGAASADVHLRPLEAGTALTSRTQVATGTKRWDSEPAELHRLRW